MLYGPGTENQNLRGFAVISPSPPEPGALLWGSSFLPAVYQGTWGADLKDSIPNLSTPQASRARRRGQVDLVERMNRLHRREREENSRLEARVASFYLAFRMQVEAPEAFDLEEESEAIRRASTGSTRSTPAPSDG